MRSTIRRTLRASGWLLVLALVFMALGCGRAAVQSEYRCPMHPEVVATRPGDCPVCGMRLVAQPAKAVSPAAEPAAHALYVCPMDPEVTSSSPGSCPKCGMKLVLRQGDPAVPAGLAPMTLPAGKRELLGMTVGEAAPHRFARHIRAAARIVPDESRLLRVTAPVGGWVDKLFVQGVGDTVRKGEALAELYNVDALTALRRDFYNLHLGNPTQSGGDPNLILSRRLDQSVLALELLQARVARWGFSDEQIKEFSESPNDLKGLVIYATGSGLIAEKSVIPGQSVNAGDPLFVVADLSRVWAEVDLLASDAPLVPVGKAFQIEAPALPGRSFPGRLAATAPFLDPQTRTQRVRLELENPGLVLHPGLPAVATLAIDLGERLAVPASSVLRTGERTYAFRLGEGDRIVPVAVRTGITDGEYVEVLEGLVAGDRVVSSATFLIDSESAMAAALRAVAER